MMINQILLAPCWALAEHILQRCQLQYGIYIMLQCRKKFIHFLQKLISFQHTYVCHRHLLLTLLPSLVHGGAQLAKASLLKTHYCHAWNPLPNLFLPKRLYSLLENSSFLPSQSFIPVSQIHLRVDFIFCQSALLHPSFAFSSFLL